MLWAWLPLLGPIRWTTLFAFGACIAVGWYRFGPLRCALAALAGISVFELAFSTTGTLVHHWPLGTLVWLWAALIAWPLLAWRENIRPSSELLVAFGIFWIWWIAEGFTFNLAAHDLRNGNLPAELLNATTKSLMVMAWALPSFNWIRRLSNQRVAVFGRSPASRPPTGGVTLDAE